MSNPLKKSERVRIVPHTVYHAGKQANKLPAEDVWAASDLYIRLANSRLRRKQRAADYRIVVDAISPPKRRFIAPWLRQCVELSLLPVDKRSGIPGDTPVKRLMHVDGDIYRPFRLRLPFKEGYLLKPDAERRHDKEPPLDPMPTPPSLETPYQRLPVEVPSHRPLITANTFAGSLIGFGAALALQGIAADQRREQL